MTAAVGLDRLPRSIRGLLGEAADNLLDVTNHLDELVRGDGAALDAITRHEAEGDRITHDLVAAVRSSRRDGPDRVGLIDLGQSIDDVVDAIEELAHCWSARPVNEFTDLMLALRDGVRDAARAVASLARPAQLETRLARARERNDEIRQRGRTGRAWLLAEQPDTQLAIRGHDLLERAQDVERACVQLRERLQARALG